MELLHVVVNIREFSDMRWKPEVPFYTHYFNAGVN